MTGFLIKTIKMNTKTDTQGNRHVQMETEGRQKAQPSDRTNPVKYLDLRCLASRTVEKYISVV